MDFRITEKGLAAMAGNDPGRPELEIAEELAIEKDEMLFKLCGDLMRGLRDFTFNQGSIAQYGYQHFTGDDVLAVQTTALFKTSMVWLDHLPDDQAMSLLEHVQNDISAFIEERKRKPITN